MGGCPEIVSDRRTVLMVDDEPFIMRAVQRVLVAAGFDVYVCENWPDISRLVQEHRPDIVLLDYHMPTLKGDDICSILKRNAVNPETKVVFYSSEDERFLREAATRCQADGYIPKQTPPDQLAGKVNGFLD